MEISTPKKTPRGKRPSLTPEQRQVKRRTNFTERVPKRVNALLLSIDKLCRHGNRAYYSYSDEEAQKIIGALRDAVTEVEDAFAQKSSGKTLFTL